MLKLIRLWVPVALCVAGIVVAILGGLDEPSLQIAIPIFSAGASIWLLNVLYRIGVQGDSERTDESDAREHFREHGAWPTEPPVTKPDDTPSTDRQDPRT